MISNQHPWDTKCTNFQTKQTTLNLWTQICPKNGFLVGFQNSKPRFGICISKIPLCTKMDNFEFFRPNLPKNGFWSQNFKNISLDFESASLRYNMHQFSDKTNNFKFLDPNLPKNGFWGRNFKTLSPDLESAFPRYHCVPIFRQNGQFWVFRPKFAQKWILESKFEKSKSGFRISILEIQHAPIFRQNEQLWIFGPKFAPKMDFGVAISKL